MNSKIGVILLKLRLKRIDCKLFHKNELNDYKEKSMGVFILTT